MTSQEMQGKVALITGGSRGIGREIAACFLRAGASVVIASRKPEGITAAARELAEETGSDRIAAVTAHVADEGQARAAVATAVERFGSLDILVNNAATNPHMGPLTELTESKAAKTTQVNQFAPILWTKLASEAWMAEHGGAVLNIASVGGLLVDPNIGYYNATKAALIHLTRQLAYELGPEIRVNVICPGLIKTELARAVWEAREDILSAGLPLRRLGTTDDIAQAASFLCSDRASWITGQSLVIDGGALSMPVGVNA
ncbi:SDR family oxidoreductase [Arthrobacter bambusae]|uniref:SDR family oxidoreductase n=1 Tax=Arthrobacter bambusae TaxID=1338426 RepID=UPI0027855DB4|nr:SDR family oxidoreductase [Arthrobacter bambusae]MDQ0242107.1 NAD(P)-dependent dehydrogenase (short-subunit alcohol dehydrogenase family) [Arthrobacter bambusae]